MAAETGTAETGGPEARAADIGDVFDALADPTRRAVVELLATRPYRAGELAQHFGLSAQAMSRHLRQLRRHRLIEHGPPLPDDARVRLYRLRREQLDGLQAWLDALRPQRGRTISKA